VPLEGYIKLELGAGEHPSFGGFVHNDIVAYPHIEIVGDCRQLRTVKPRTVTIIRAIHLLEHFAPTDARSALLVWVSRLCRGGVLEVAVPDLQTLALMAVLDNITIEACLRDVYGLGKVPDLPDDELRQCIRTLSGGCNLPSLEWYTALQILYGPIWKRERGNPQAHKWGYCEVTLRNALVRADLERVVVKHEGTSLHGWGVKP